MNQVRARFYPPPGFAGGGQSGGRAALPVNKCRDTCRPFPPPCPPPAKPGEGGEGEGFDLPKSVGAARWQIAIKSGKARLA